MTVDIALALLQPEAVEIPWVLLAYGHETVAWAFHVLFLLVLRLILYTSLLPTTILVPHPALRHSTNFLNLRYQPI